MTSRGRGYGARGNYGGGSRGGGYRGNSYRGNRGSYEGRGGRGGYSSYVSNDRYNNDNMDRYQSRNDSYREESYKKPYRADTMSSYNSREYVPRGASPDRKRMRMEGSSGDRRGHDGGYSGSYSSRQEGYGRSYSGERRRSPSREGYRKSSIGMPPPRSPQRSAPRTRSSAPIRRYRGRVMRSRASYRGAPIRSRGYGTRRLTSRSDYFPRPRVTKIRSSIKVKPDSGTSTEGEDWDAEDKDEVEEDDEDVKDEAGEVKVKVKGEAKEGEAEEEEAGEGSATDKEGAEDAVSEEGDDTKSKISAKRTYIPLACLHCKEQCVTFKAYEKHLLTLKHRTAMGVVAGRRKQQLLRLRANQRNQQRELETRRPSSLAARTAYCPLCKLNHRTPRHTHNLSELHRATKRFLFPFCKICRVACRSPMIYEHHLCSLEHIRRKVRHEARTPSEIQAEKAAASAEEGMDVDLENFMTLDSVGDVDEVEDEESGGEKKEEEEGTEKPKVEINIGSEHIKKLEVYWCELCNLYLPRSEDEEGAAAQLRRHCRMRHHLGRYVRHRDNRTLRKHAERIHRQLQKKIKAESEGTSKESKVKAEGADESMDTSSVAGEAGSAEQAEGSVTAGAAAAATENGAAGADEKLWADVDKDLGELLREVDQAAKSSDDEEDTGRYDKFRKSDKAGVVGGVEAEPSDAGPAAAADVVAPVTAALNTSA